VDPQGAKSGSLNDYLEMCARKKNAKTISTTPLAACAGFPWVVFFEQLPRMLDAGGRTFAEPFASETDTLRNAEESIQRASAKDDLVFQEWRVGTLSIIICAAPYRWPASEKGRVCSCRPSRNLPVSCRQWRWRVCSHIHVCLAGAPCVCRPSSSWALSAVVGRRS